MVWVVFLKYLYLLYFPLFYSKWIENDTSLITTNVILHLVTHSHTELGEH